MSVPAKGAETRRLVDKLWSYCQLLRRDGLSLPDCLDQLTLLLVLKLVHEVPSAGPAAGVPAHLSWPTLVQADGKELTDQYKRVLEGLGRQQDSALGLILHRAENKIREAATLKHLVHDLIDKVNWSAIGTDRMGDIYEALLGKITDTTPGARRFFTPRAIIDAIVECAQPEPGDTIVDPACGTGGFLVAAYRYLLTRHPAELRKPREGSIQGVELVQDIARLAQLNLLLHGLGTAAGRALIKVRDALTGPAELASLVLASPPFGRNARPISMDELDRPTHDNAGSDRMEPWVKTGNQELNWLQHIANLLTTNGRAAVIVPDNVLFEGAAGEHIRRRLLKDFDVHTLLRLPTGIFYAAGVGANVLFFDHRPARTEGNWTTKLWVYDLRTDQHFSPRGPKLQRHHLDDFVTCYLPGANREWRTESERFKSFTIDDLLARHQANLDITWRRDQDEFQPPTVIAAEIADDLRAALDEIEAVAEALQRGRPEREYLDNQP